MPKIRLWDGRHYDEATLLANHPLLLSLARANSSLEERLNAGYQVSGLQRSLRVGVEAITSTICAPVAAEPLVPKGTPAREH